MWFSYINRTKYKEGNQPPIHQMSSKCQSVCWRLWHKTEEDKQAQAHVGYELSGDEGPSICSGLEWL